MISLSHWGMFEVEAPRLVAPEGLFSEADMAEWMKPGGLIRFVGASVPNRALLERLKRAAQPTYRAPDWGPA